MKKSYILIAMAALTIAVSCRRSENELPEQTGRAKIKTLLVGFASSDAVQMGDAQPTPQVQYAPQTTPNGKQIGVITLRGAVDTLALSKLTNSPTRAHSTEEFRTGDMIGVYVHIDAQVGQGEANHTVNTPYIMANGAEWHPVYALGGAYTEPTYHMSAYYPYNETFVNAWEIPHSVALDQSAPSSTVSGALEKSNLLIARGATVDNATTNPSASLDFVHAMSLFEVKILLPQMVEGRELDSLESIIVKGTETRATLNLATGGLTIVAGNKADIKPRRTAGNGRPGVVSVYESIVVPQNVTEGATLLEIRCRMVDGSLESFDYVIPKQNWMSFKSGYRTSITLMPTAEASFMGELPLLVDGLAHEDMALPIFVDKDLRWELSIKNIDWMTISDAAGGVYGKTLSGMSTTGAITNIYVKVDANASQTMPRQGEMTLRAYRADGSEVAPAVYLAVQNYYNFSGTGSTWDALAGRSTSPVAAFSGNQMWTATSGAEWVKLARSATFGDGDPAVSYSHVGALGAGELFLQADANNSAAAREATVSFASTHVGGTSFSYTVKQAVASITLNETELSVGKDAAADVELFTVTAPVGVKWKILSLKPETGKDMGLTLNLATGAEQVGTGAAQVVKGGYAANALSTSRYTNVVVAYAAYGAAQQMTFKLTQAAAGPEYITIGGLKWTKGNLIADGANGCKVGEPGDGGLYFQYGGLVGYKGGATGDGTGITDAAKHPNGKWWNGAAAYSAADVAVKPATYLTQATWPYFNNVATGGFGYYYFNTFVTKYADFQSQIGANNPTLGIGDPCAYYIGNGWRLPTVYELSAIAGSAVEGSWVPWSTAGVTGKWTNSGPQSTMGAWFGPNSRSGTPTINTDLFIPASGHRNNTNGSFRYVGIYGFLWSSSVYNAAYGFDLQIHESDGVIPRAGNYRAHAFPVRCVQDLPHEPTPPTADQVVEAGGLKWTTGNLVANGTHNAKVGAPEDGGLYFQFGSLIGWKGGATGDGTGRAAKANGTFYVGSSFNAANEVQVYPSEFTKITDIGIIWPDQSINLYYFGLSTYTSGDLHSFVGFSTGLLAVSGVGDPCRYYLGDTWRLPTYLETEVMTDQATKTHPGSWTNATSTDSYFVCTFSGVGELKFPAVGLRNGSDGAIYYVGDRGFYWSSSVLSSSNGYLLYFNNGSVYPQGSRDRRSGFPVRCVQDLPPVEINGVKWSLSNVSNSATWDTAMTLCKSPWRLPSYDDFENLINSGKMSQVTGISSGYYWSSTEYLTNFAYCLSFGLLGSTTKDTNYYVRCCQ